MIGVPGPAKAPARRRSYVHWLWLLPALFFVSVFLIYPSVETFRTSLLNADSSSYVGAENYIQVFSDSASRGALLNNLLWLSLFTLLTVALGLVLAVLTGGVRYESVAKAMIFIPMAISFVAAAVIWKFIYAYNPPGSEQIGLLNAIGTSLGFPPHAWLVEQQIAGQSLPTPLHANNFAIIIVGVWMWTGFAMVILSAALKDIPVEIIEAARVDGANRWQIFRRIMLPLVAPALGVMATTLVIQGLKQFDIVWVITAGNYGTDVIATRMYKEMFNYRDFGRAAALAVVLLIAIIPIMAINIRRFLVGRKDQ